MECIKDIDCIYKNVSKKFERELEVEFITENNYSLSEEEFKEIVDRAIERLKEKNSTSRSFLCFYKVYLNDDKIIIELNEENAVYILKELKINTKLELLLAEYGIKGKNVYFVNGNFSEELTNLEIQIEKSIAEAQKKVEVERAELAKNISSTQSNGNNNYSTGTFNGNNSKPSFRRESKTKEIKDKSMPIVDFYTLYDGELCTVEGEIFFVEDRTTRNGKILRTIMLNDNTSSMTAKIFMDSEDSLVLKEGQYVKINGKLQVDTFSNNEKIMMINSINFLEKTKNKRIDTAEEKMVELHTHSKMSEMVGVTDIEDLIKRAKEYGHSHIAITDYSVVHSYPSAYKMIKNIKKAAQENEKTIDIIFGCEMYMVDDEENMISNPKNVTIDEEEYIVFDLETLGLNSHKNEIIEIGAAKVKGGKIVDTFGRLINPQKRVPTKITEITGITTEMLVDKPTIEPVLKEFINFIGDAVLVAHNAPFDMGFIKRDIKKTKKKAE